MITLYHGSNTSEIKVLKPNLADHDRPYVYMTTIDAVALFYLCNAVQRPYYWFPYGFERGSDIPVYNELYPNALREVSEGVSGCIYTVRISEDEVIPFANIPCARLATVPVQVSESTPVDDAYELLKEYERQGKIKVGRFEDKSPRELEMFYNMIIGYMREKEMQKTPDCSYARFVRKKLPKVWEKFINEMSV